MSERHIFPEKGKSCNNILNQSGADYIADFVGWDLYAHDGFEKFVTFPEFLFHFMDHPEEIRDCNRTVELIKPFYEEMNEWDKHNSYWIHEYAELAKDDAEKFAANALWNDCVYSMNEFPVSLANTVNDYLYCVSPFFPKEKNMDAEYLRKLARQIKKFIKLISPEYNKRYSVRIFDAEHTLGFRGKTITIVLATSACFGKHVVDCHFAYKWEDKKTGYVVPADDLTGGDF